MNIRSLLYTVAKPMGDVNAVKKRQGRKANRPQSCRKAHRAHPGEVVQVTHAPVGFPKPEARERQRRHLCVAGFAVAQSMCGGLFVAILV